MPLNEKYPQSLLLVILPKLQIESAGSFWVQTTLWPLAVLFCFFGQITQILGLVLTGDTSMSSQAQDRWGHAKQKHKHKCKTNTRRTKLEFLLYWHQGLVSHLGCVQCKYKCQQLFWHKEMETKIISGHVHGWLHFASSRLPCTCAYACATNVNFYVKSPLSVAVSVTNKKKLLGDIHELHHTSKYSMFNIIKRKWISPNVVGCSIPEIVHLKHWVRYSTFTHCQAMNCKRVINIWQLWLRNQNKWIKWGREGKSARFLHNAIH